MLSHNRNLLLDFQQYIRYIEIEVPGETTDLSQVQALDTISMQKCQ